MVDDHADSAEVLSLLLEESRCVVRTVDSTQALSAALEFLPMVALIDIGQPGLDGFELCKAMRAEPRLADCRYVSVTGYTVGEDERRSQSAGFHAHLRKPVDFPTLFHLIAGELLACPAYLSAVPPSNG